MKRRDILWLVKIASAMIAKKMQKEINFVDSTGIDKNSSGYKQFMDIYVQSIVKLSYILEEVGKEALTSKTSQIDRMKAKVIDMAKFESEVLNLVDLVMNYSELFEIRDHFVNSTQDELSPLTIKWINEYKRRARI